MSPFPRHALARRAPAGLKLGLAVGAVVGIVLLPRGAWAAYAVAGAALVVVAALARVRAGSVLRRLLVAAPFVLGVAILSLLQPRGGTVFATTLAKSAACLLAMALLAETTPFADLLDVLRRARVPPLLVTTLGLTERYLAVLREEAARMRRARRARTFDRSRRAAWAAAASVAAHLFVRTTVRAERVHAAMRARGAP